ncbi:hypothetical protein KC356_g281 [Hortaea werneckii]|nr:hypothetical protein KC356_g281 [Hortaea werneckii]
MQSRLTTATMIMTPTTLMIRLRVRHHLALSQFFSSRHLFSASPASCLVNAAAMSSSLPPPMLFSRSSALIGRFGRGKTEANIQSNGQMKPRANSNICLLQREAPHLGWPDGNVSEGLPFRLSGRGLLKMPRESGLLSSSPEGRLRLLRAPVPSRGLRWRLQLRNCIKILIAVSALWNRRYWRQRPVVAFGLEKRLRFGALFAESSQRQITLVLFTAMVCYWRHLRSKSRYRVRSDSGAGWWYHSHWR